MTIPAWKIFQEVHPSNAQRPRHKDKFGPVVGVSIIAPQDIEAYLEKLHEDTGICHSAERL